MLLNARSDRSTNRINDVSFNFINNNNKTSDGLTKIGEDDIRSNISAINITQNEKSNKPKVTIDEDSELILQQMLKILNEYNKSIK